MDHGLGDSQKTVTSVATMEATQQKENKYGFCLSVWQSVCLSVWQVCLSVCPSVRPSARLSVGMSFCPSEGLSVCHLVSFGI